MVANKLECVYLILSIAVFGFLTLWNISLLCMPDDLRREFVLYKSRILNFIYFVFFGFMMISSIYLPYYCINKITSSLFFLFYMV